MGAVLTLKPPSGREDVERSETGGSLRALQILRFCRYAALRRLDNQAKQVCKLACKDASADCSASASAMPKQARSAALKRRCSHGVYVAPMAQLDICPSGIRYASYGGSICSPCLRSGRTRGVVYQWQNKCFLESRGDSAHRAMSVAALPRCDYTNRPSTGV